LEIFIGDSVYSGKLNYLLGIFIGDSVYSSKENYLLGILVIHQMRIIYWGFCLFSKGELFFGDSDHSGKLNFWGIFIGDSGTIAQNLCQIHSIKGKQNCTRW
jgi:hypothetical protein